MTNVHRLMFRRTVFGASVRLEGSWDLEVVVLFARGASDLTSGRTNSLYLF